MMNDIAVVLNEKHLLVKLVQDADKMHVGFVVHMTYESVTVLTNDKWKWRAGGIPQNSLYLGTVGYTHLAAIGRYSLGR